MRRPSGFHQERARAYLPAVRSPQVDHLLRVQADGHPYQLDDTGCVLDLPLTETGETVRKPKLFGLNHIALEVSAL